jgi:hypothetical protein
MNKADKELLRKAVYLRDHESCTQWGEVLSIVDKATSKKAKDQIKAIAGSMYHSEEWLINNE